MDPTQLMEPLGTLLDKTYEEVGLGIIIDIVMKILETRKFKEEVIISRIRPNYRRQNKYKQDPPFFQKANGDYKHNNDNSPSNLARYRGGYDFSGNVQRFQPQNTITDDEQPGCSHLTSKIRPINLSCLTKYNSKSHNYNNPNQNPSLIDSAIPCRICGRTFTAKTGVGIHMRRTHPDEHDQNKARTNVKQRWSEEEEVLTANGTRFLNKALAPLFPTRSLEAIKKARQKETYRKRVLEYIRELL
uniref:C2H2-type domain-containing protein n=1 Tax=Glossina palpalis gambiensis TaxID=67801 RepID=A0A1B0B7F1_9MUSC